MHSSSRLSRKIIFLVGPTGIGKTDIAFSLAKKINAEIVSCDSMQVYQGMGILTSKPPASLRKKVKHHLIGVISSGKEYDVSRYRKDALGAVNKIINKGRVPLFAGGTGLYMSILIDGIFAAEQKNKSIRKRLYRLAETYGNQYLYKRLQNTDPEAALKIHPNDIKRVIRALEVFESAGKPLSYLQKQRKGLGDEYEVKVFCLNMPREKLYQRIDERVEKMFKQGIVCEVKRLLKCRVGRTASYAIGIRELKGYFNGKYDLEEAKRLMKRNTRLYAKRQLTWFRKDKRINWINIMDKEKPKEIAERIWKGLS